MMGAASLGRQSVFFQRTACENNTKTLVQQAKKIKAVSAYKVIGKDLAEYPIWRMWLKNNLRLPFSSGTIGVLAKKKKKKRTIHPEPHYLGDAQSFIWLPLKTCVSEEKFFLYLRFVSLFPAENWEGAVCV